MIEASSNVIFLLHGKSGSPEGSVKEIEAALREHLPELRCFRPLMPHANPTSPAERSVEALQRIDIPSGAMLIGVSLGGLVTAKFQEEHRPDLQAICINSPTWADGVRLEQLSSRRVSFYSSLDEVIMGRTENWPKLAESYDLPWLTHDTSAHVPRLVQLILAYRSGDDVRQVVAKLDAPLRN